MRYLANRGPRTFVPASPSAFFDRYPFVRREDASLVRDILGAINAPQALAEMLRSIDDGEPPLAGVAHRIDAHLSAMRAQAAHDASARARLHGLTRISGALVREVLDVNGVEKTGRSRSMPKETRQVAGTAAMFRAAAAAARADQKRSMVTGTPS